MVDNVKVSLNSLHNSQVTTAANNCHFFTAGWLVAACSNGDPFTASMFNDSSPCCLDTA
jgi:hypothetical protein